MWIISWDHEYPDFQILNFDHSRVLKDKRRYERHMGSILLNHNKLFDISFHTITEWNQWKYGIEKEIY